MKKFEYKVEKIKIKGGTLSEPHLDNSGLDDLLQTLGMQGWEMVSCITMQETYGASRGLLLAFKREIEE